MTLKIFKSVVRLAGMQSRDQSTYCWPKETEKKQDHFHSKWVQSSANTQNLGVLRKSGKPSHIWTTKCENRRCHNSGHYLVPACLNSFCLTILMNWIYFDFQILTLSWLSLFQVGTTVCQNWPYEWSTTTNQWQWLCQLLTLLELIWLSGYLFL